jgi:hypothetical protein
MQIGADLESLRRRSAKDLILYVIVGILIMGMVAGMLWAGLSWDFLIKWVLGLAFLTAACFWLFLDDSRSMSQIRQFWFLFSSFLVVHCLMWTFLLRRTEHWKFIWFAPMYIEMAALQYCRNRLFGDPLQRKRRLSRGHQTEDDERRQ